MKWFDKLKNISSLGSTTKRPGSLAGLHKARKENLGQYFTPVPVQNLIWEIIHNVMDGQKRNSKISLFDNSCGIGSMFWNASPDDYKLYGCDVHGDSIKALSKALGKTEFTYEVLNCAMEDLFICKNQFEFAVINPPFSIHLDSPNLDDSFKCANYGVYGPNSSALSHAYALEQALYASEVVVAILPTTYAYKLVEEEHKRLVAVYDLPLNTFTRQGANVYTSVCVFGAEYCDISGLFLEKLSGRFEPNRMPNIRLCGYVSAIIFREKGTDYSKPSITLPVTNDDDVYVAHNGRKIILKFKCGLTQAKVLNAIFVRKAKSCDDKRRLAKHVKYRGQGVLDIELLLIQSDPIKSFYSNLVGVINNNGGKARIDIGLINYIKKRAKFHGRIIEPFSHTVFVPSGSVQNSKYQAVRDCLIKTDSFISPVVDKGDVIDIKELDGFYTCEYKGEVYNLDESFILDNFKPLENVRESEWKLKHSGKSVAFPDLAHEINARMDKLDIKSYLSWGFQHKDLCEAMITPKNSLISWDMGLGKTRFAIGAIMLSGVKHGLIVVMSKLVYEFVRQIKEDLSQWIDVDDVNVIDSLDTVNNLKKINIISYSKLWRSPKDSTNKSYAKHLRRRIGLAVADEAHLLSNYTTKQSRAVALLSPKKLICMSGTIIPNYPRNIHPILNITAGDGVAHQPWGIHNGHLKKHHIINMDDAYTGSKEFLDEFVTLEWVTHEFEDGLIHGAKREIPKIGNVVEYRKMLAPFLKRRLSQEPAVKKHISVPVPNKRDVLLDWDFDHLAYYLKVCEQFTCLWKQAFRDPGENNSLAAILPRINAILSASNRPFVGSSVGGLDGYCPPTPKDRYCVKRVGQWLNESKKIIVFFNSPDNVDRIYDMLNDVGIESLKYTGKITAVKRAKLLNDKFKKGNVNVLLATKASLSEGENIPGASRILFYDRSWLPKVEIQCYSRVLRVGQKDEVKVEFLMYKGGIDEYQKQMCDFKQDASNAGLDYADPRFNDDEFVHMESILHKFVGGLDEMDKMLINDLKNVA